MANPKASSSSAAWYKTERNTEVLVKAVLAKRSVRSLSGEDIWWLIKLTWITASAGRTVELHWQRLKVPALSHLLKKSADIGDDLTQTIASMRLPEPVSQAASTSTGFVNTYRAYRNSLLTWCTANKEDVLAIIGAAQRLGANDQARFDLAKRVSQLPSVPTPNAERSMAASSLITPLVACLDPKRRFPVINGEAGVTRRLAKLKLSDRSLEDKVRGFVGIIGQFGIADAFALDTMDDDLIDKIRTRAPKAPKSIPIATKGKPLSDLDDSEVKAALQARTVIYRHRHNTMTERLKELFPKFELTQGDRQDCRYDVLITGYDGRGRHLLIEVKPDPDMGSLRIAIGQLFDYRRFLPHQAGTDLAILTITRPSQSYIDLLQDLQITSLWFADDTCHGLSGDGKTWKAVAAGMGA